MSDAEVIANALAAVGLPESASLDELIQHHRANAALAATFDAMRGSAPVPAAPNEPLSQEMRETVRDWTEMPRLRPLAVPP